MLNDNTIPYFARLLFFAPFLLVLATVFIIETSLAEKTVSGKYFWLCGSMGLVGITTFIHTLTNKQPFLFPLSIRNGSVYLGDEMINDYTFTIIGKAVIVVRSKDLNSGKILWNRFFKKIK